MTTFKVRIQGIPELEERLSTKNLGDGLKVGLRRAGTRVEGTAKRLVHSPDNPYIGKAGYSVSTGRLQKSIGTSGLRGSGLDLEIAVGPGHRSTGAPGSVFSRGQRVLVDGKVRRGRTGAKVAATRGPRGGVRFVGGRNTGSPEVYGKYEEEGTHRGHKAHPFLGPALDHNRLDITRDIEDALQTELSFKK